MDAKIRITGVYDPEPSLEQVFSKPVWTDFARVDAFDMCFISDLNSPYELYKSLVKDLGINRGFIPDVLGITAQPEKVG